LGKLSRSPNLQRAIKRERGSAGILLSNKRKEGSIKGSRRGGYLLEIDLVTKKGKRGSGGVCIQKKPKKKNE